MRAVQVSSAGGAFELVERDIPQPGPGHIRVKVEACGICHSDRFVKEGLFPGLTYPRVPGHEVVGVVDAVGPDVSQWKAGQRVGVGWHGGHCFQCRSCRAGDFVTCAHEQITGISSDGGYAEYMIARQEAVALVPDGMDAAEAAPLLCAGITTYNALRNSGARGGDVVAIQGVGGLGHLGVQYARKLGFTTVAISRGADKQELALELGAHRYLDTTSDDVVAELQAMGGARVILATAPSSKAMTALIDGLGVGGKLVVVGASPEPIEVSPFHIIGARRSVVGWPSGTAWDSEDTLRFSATAGVKTRIESFPLARAAEAYDRALGNQARFRVVLTLG